MAELAAKKKKEFIAPDTYVILFFVILFSAFLTYVVPVGSFQTHEVKYTIDGKEKTKTVLDPSTFAYQKDEKGNQVIKGVPLFDLDTSHDVQRGLLNYVFEGLVSGDRWGSAVGIVAFILIIGGSFGIILKTGAVDAGLLAAIKGTSKSGVIIIPILFTLFSLGGAVFGMGEEAIAFIMVLMPIIIALGYDAIVAVMVTYGATQIGFATSWMNPFGIVIAQGVSGVTPLSGSTFRMAMWAIFTLGGIVYVWMYANKIKKDPKKSLTYDSDNFFRDELKDAKEMHNNFTLGHKLILLTLALGIVWIVWGVTQNGYYIPEIATQFFVIGIAIGIIAVLFKVNNMTLNGMADAFRFGVKDIVGAAIIVGMAKGVIIILGGTSATDPTVLNTVLYSVGNGLKDLPPSVSAWFMYLFQTIFNFFVVSGSGQAALTMPLMAPLSDIVGVSRQTACLAFQLGDGLSNMIIPTSGALMGTLAAAKVDFVKWFKFQIWFQIFLFLLGSGFVIFAVLTNFS